MKKRYLGLLIIIGIGFGVITFINKKTYLSEDDVIGVYINNELSTDIPSKDSALFQKAVCDDENVSATWDSESWGLLLKNLTKKTKCNLYFYSGETVFNFDYTGGEQTFITPVSGTYKLETWGAEGGYGITKGLHSQGGYGGYSEGKVYLKAGEKLYINVGQGGVNGEENYASCTDISYLRTSYNGGGTGSVNCNCNWGGGGGATHIAKKSGLLSDLEKVKNDILIVSGGGGGGGICVNQNQVDSYQNGASAGGFIGNAVNGSCADNAPTGGTQTSGGKGHYNEVKGYFGQGGTYGSGGGGGFYGGSQGWNCGSGAGGGSGYIGNSLLTNKVMYCYNCEESSEESTKTISTTCSEETPTENCAKKGNGYARITLVSIDE